MTIQMILGSSFLMMTMITMMTMKIKTKKWPISLSMTLMKMKRLIKIIKA